MKYITKQTIKYFVVQVSFYRIIINIFYLHDQAINEESNESLLSVNQPYEQKLHAQIQAVHAQSPRTVQRNVDQITSEIKNNCDLRKSINFKFNNEEDNSGKIDIMDCEEHEPMEQVEEECFELPTKDINPFDKNLIAGLLKNIKFPQSHHADGYTRIDTNLNKFVPSTITLGTCSFCLDIKIYVITFSLFVSFISFTPNYTRTFVTMQAMKRTIWKSALGKECTEQFLKRSICRRMKPLLLKRKSPPGSGNIISYER